MNIRNDANVLSFVEIARRYCALLAAKPNDEQKWKYDLVNTLPSLYVAAQTLPCVNLSDTNQIPDGVYDVTQDEWHRVFQLVGTIFGENDLYWSEYDPTEMPKTDDIRACTSISNDLADIYRDIMPGLRAWDAQKDEYLPEIIF